MLIDRELVNKCLICENTSFDKVLVQIEKDGEQKHVCISCLPGVIHG
ncbi:MAG: hypothetical protein PHS92_01270 [Candidatus Gracilibacteria bacterium]|nr:hypothetical protein [Candidatus Gracilibacteria bacterium]